MRILMMSILLLLSIFILSCDKFPENAAITTNNGVATVVFRQCSSGEHVERITVLQKVGQGDADNAYQQIWQANVAPGFGADALWPLNPSDPRYLNSTGLLPGDLSHDAFRVYVATSKHEVLLAFGPGLPAEGTVRRLGKDTSIREFLKRNDIC